MVNVAIVGARGYMGRELVRLLQTHSQVESLALVTSGEPGALYGDSVPAFRGTRNQSLRLVGPNAARDADVVFLATDAEEAKKNVAELGDAPKLLVDLSRAHRHQAFEKGSGWTYGLSELFAVPKGTKRIANPGCYVTASLLSIVPAVRAGLVGPGAVIADGKSGTSGAGATPRADLHFTDQNEAVRAYKALAHDHQAEISLGAARRVKFTPHLVPMNRGLLSTVYMPAAGGVTQAKLQAVYEATYAKSNFVRLVAEPDTAHVRLSNYADLRIDHDEPNGLLLARCAIDNLTKGGSGQAVQNMNHALGFAETDGLPAVGA